jgi:hypothetical protein
VVRLAGFVILQPFSWALPFYFEVGKYLGCVRIAVGFVHIFIFLGPDAAERRDAFLDGCRSVAARFRWEARRDD